jgi:hypothetical protein
MKRFMTVAVAVAAVAGLVGVAFAQMGGPMAGGMGRMGAMMGGRGPGMMGAGPGSAGCPGMAADAGQAPAAQVTEERAKELAQEYVSRHLTGFTVERVLPFQGMHGTAYSVELKGPRDEVRVLHVNPWGNVMPFGGPGRRAG